MSDAIAVAITGASGAQYPLRLIEQLLAAGRTVQLMCSQAGQVVLNMETDLKVPGNTSEMQKFFCEHFGVTDQQLQVFGRQQWTAPVASGTHLKRWWCVLVRQAHWQPSRMVSVMT
jgi:4-hydroxy-3-polyprenylbenzoate decarboxylase